MHNQRSMRCRLYYAILYGVASDMGPWKVRRCCHHDHHVDLSSVDGLQRCAHSGIRLADRSCRPMQPKFGPPVKIQCWLCSAYQGTLMQTVLLLLVLQQQRAVKSSILALRSISWGMSDAVTPASTLVSPDPVAQCDPLSLHDYRHVASLGGFRSTKVSSPVHLMLQPSRVNKVVDIVTNRVGRLQILRTP
ncbi:hypothetical protein BJX99DRAFT_33110 [Aspergillus californicus]